MTGAQHILSRRVVAGGIVVLLVAVGGYAYADSRGSGTSYRTAVTSTGTVERLLSVGGTVGASGRRDLSFGASGTVKKVQVKQGEHVRKGQVIARLDGTGLKADVVAAKATLAKARAQLVTDDNSSSSSSSSDSSASSASGGGKKGGSGKSGGTPSGSPSGGKPSNNGGNSSGGNPGGSKPGGSSPSGSGSAPVLDSSAITAAQTTLTTDTTTLTTALDNYVDFVESTCTSSDTAGSGRPCDPAGTALCPDPTRAPSTLAEAKACVATAQTAIATDASALSAAATTVVDNYLAAAKKYAAGLVAAGKAQGAAEGKTEGQAEAAGLIAQAKQQAAQILAQAQKQASAASKNASSGGFAGASTGESSTSRITSDEAAIASAKASLISARESARAATLRAPISGKVVAVSIAKGDGVSTSDVVVSLLGRGDTTVTSAVSLSQIKEVKLGQQATVVPAGWRKKLQGKVTQIGLVATTSSSGSTTYPVTVTIDDAPSIPLGMTASVAVVTGSAKNAVTVPTSAVSTTTRGSSVVVLEDGKATTRQVTTGLVGTTLTSIASGLKAGQTVILADLGASLPSSNSSTNSGRSGLGGSVGGFGGGLPGGVVIRSR